jgi:hypothetical protein
MEFLNNAEELESSEGQEIILGEFIVPVNEGDASDQNGTCSSSIFDLTSFGQGVDGFLPI